MFAFSVVLALQSVALRYHSLMCCRWIHRSEEYSGNKTFINIDMLDFLAAGELFPFTDYPAPKLWANPGSLFRGQIFQDFKIDIYI